MQNKDIRTRLSGIEQTLRSQILLNKAVLTIAEAARYLGITKKQLTELIRMRVIPFHLQFGNIYFKRVELELWMTGDKPKWFSAGFFKHLFKLVPWLSILIKFLGPAAN